MEPQQFHEQLSKHKHDILAFSDRCILCNVRRPKGDGEWLMSVARDDEQRNVVIFICPKDRKKLEELFPHMQQEGTFNMYGLRQLDNLYKNEIKLAKPGKRFYVKKSV
jgi:hypothetical protein